MHIFEGYFQYYLDAFLNLRIATVESSDGIKRLSIQNATQKIARCVFLGPR